jgi:hypothetical protein
LPGFPSTTILLKKYMKKLLLLMTVSCLVFSARAQEFQKGTNIISAGVGLGSSILSYSAASQTPALSLQYERGVWDIGGPGVISLGGYVGYKGYSYSATDYSEKWHYTVLGVRSAYHYNGLNVEKLDLYGGVMLSYNILSYSYSDIGGYNFSGSGSYGSTVGFSLYVGARYFFTDNLAVLAELGYGVAYLNVGIAAKF